MKKICKLKEDYSNDYDIEYLLERLKAFTDRIKPLLSDDLFYTLFSKPQEEISNSDYIYKEVCYSFSDSNNEKRWSRWTRLKQSQIAHFIREHDGAELYMTVQKFRNAEKVFGEDFIMPFFADIDVDDTENLDMARKEALLIINKMIALDIPINLIQLYFSGSKGFHVIVDEAVFGFTPSADMHKKIEHIHNALRKELKLENLCSATGNRKMLRIQNTPNMKSGLYKISLPISDIFEDISTIKNMAISPKKKEKVGIPLKVEEASKWATSTLRNYKQRSFQKAITGPIDNYTPKCVEDLINYGIKVRGTRNKATLVLAGYYKDSGVSEDGCVELLREWTKRIPDNMTSARNGEKLLGLESCVKTVYSSDNYHFACPFIRSLGYKVDCPQDCLLSKRSKK